jgi:hypothetical protein
MLLTQTLDNFMTSFVSKEKISTLPYASQTEALDSLIQQVKTGVL